LHVFVTCPDIPSKIPLCLGSAWSPNGDSGESVFRDRVGKRSIRLARERRESVTLRSNFRVYLVWLRLHLKRLRLWFLWWSGFSGEGGAVLEKRLAKLLLTV
jgi:hypothetical protein